jgi:hypothetical protein
MIYFLYIIIAIEILASIVALVLSIIFLYSFIKRKDINYCSKYLSIQIKYYK